MARRPSVLSLVDIAGRMVLAELDLRPGNGVPGGEYLEWMAVQPEVDDPHARRGQQVVQPAPTRVGCERGDQGDRAVVPGGEQGREAGAAGPRVVGQIVDHRHGRVRGQSTHGALEVDVEQRVADDHEWRPARRRQCC